MPLGRDRPQRSCGERHFAIKVLKLFLVFKVSLAGTINDMLILLVHFLHSSFSFVLFNVRSRTPRVSEDVCRTENEPTMVSTWKPSPLYTASISGGRWGCACGPAAARTRRTGAAPPSSVRSTSSRRRTVSRTIRRASSSCASATTTPRSASSLALYHWKAWLLIGVWLGLSADLFHQLATKLRDRIQFEKNKQKKRVGRQR